MRHQNTSRCYKDQQRNLNECLQVTKPLSNQKDASPKEPFTGTEFNLTLAWMRANPQITIFKTLPVRSVTTFMTRSFEVPETSSEILVDQQRGDLIGSRYVTINKCEKSLIQMSLDECPLLSMTVEDLYQFARIFQPQSDNSTVTINLIQLLMGNAQYLPLVGGHVLRVTGEFVRYSAEIICLDSDERQRVEGCSHEFIVFGFHAMEIKDDILLVTRYPVTDLLALTPNPIYFTINKGIDQQTVSERYGLGFRCLGKNKMNNQIHYFTTCPHTIDPTKIENWSGWIIPTTLKISVSEPTHVLFRYVTHLDLKNNDGHGDCNYHSGLVEPESLK
jgi:hypothetical protein